MGNLNPDEKYMQLVLSDIRKSDSHWEKVSDDFFEGKATYLEVASAMDQCNIAERRFLDLQRKLHSSRLKE